MTKTEAKLIAKIDAAKKAGHGYIDVDGAREVSAAKKIAARGIATYTNLGGMSGGKYYIHPITRTAAVTKSSYVYGGRLSFAA
jgi:expansin (peptidoglycan-binding protein)